MSAHIAAAEARRPRPSSAARRAAVGALALLLGAIAPPVPGVAAPGDSPAVAEVGRLPVLASGTVRDWSGWLILSPKSRRLYQVLENPLTTEIQSFDLDTLARRRRATFRGSPVLGGLGNGTGASGTTQFVGEALHAVDEERGLLYLPMMDPLDAVALAGLTVAGLPAGAPDGARPLTRMVVIDEKRFDAGAADFSASFVPPPATATVARTHWLQGMETVADPRGGPARLVLAFAQPGLRQTPAPNHTVTAWDVDTPAWSATPDPVVFPPADTPTGWETPPPLAAQCGRATMTDTSFPTHGAYSWGLLPTAKALYLVCQASPGSGQVVRIALDPATGAPVKSGEEATPRTFRLAKPVGDVLVDRAGGRLLLRANTPTKGSSWWVFDTAVDRFVGAMAGTLNDATTAAYGLDQGSGRFYALLPNYEATTGGKTTAVRGGLHSADIRVDPVPALTNVAPSLAYPAVKRIVVDPVTHRVFVRLGHTTVTHAPRYPDLTLVPAPMEPFYRVLADRAAPSARQAAPDDSAFTTDTAESAGVTRASYYAATSAYGSRALLIGGPAAATSKGAGDLADAFHASDCEGDRNDRELVVGGVRQAVLSDLSAEAAAAGLAADAVTRDHLGRPVAGCTPRVAESHAKDKPGWDTEGYPFDTDADDEADDFTAGCVGSGSPAAGRDGNTASVACDHEGRKVTAEATGTMASGPFAQRVTKVGALGGLGAKVGWSHSETTLEPDARRGGMVARVTSVARNVEIPLGAGAGVMRIGVVRATAESWASGRRGRAQASFVRTVCGVDLPPGASGSDAPANGSCRSSDNEQGRKDLAALEALVRDRSAGQVEVHFKAPDAAFLAGSASGYQAAVQRDRNDRFTDRSIVRDDSLAVPGMEVMFYRGDSPTYGAGRQILQFAGVQASTSYGIACLWGQGRDGDCAKGFTDGLGDLGGGADGLDGDTFAGVDGDAGSSRLLALGSELRPSAGDRDGGGGGRGGLLRRLLAVPADVARLLFSNPREFGLLLAVWALLYAPCYLGERRRALGRLAAAPGGAA